MTSKLKSKRKNFNTFGEMDFDTEGFIMEVQNRPAIWNTKCVEYNDRELRLQAWNELVDMYGGDHDMSRAERKQLGVHLRKKWRNVRDCFVKVHKAKTKGCDDKKKIHYAHYDNLLFLAETVSGNTVFNVADFKNETHNDEDDPLSVVRLKKRRNIDPLESGDSALNKKEKTQERERNMAEEEEDRMFFLSLVKEFNKIPEYSRIQAKIDLLQVIKDAQYSD
ncbi:uncharacterized protein LOC134676424 [Cydia fagiglandana]|uniref:uncharacterized protein LOC134676424 n=1 Tax=Cydia fagiglandana TaxID=1458189 RepID=UPI002FEDFA4A